MISKTFTVFGFSWYVWWEAAMIKNKSATINHIHCHEDPVWIRPHYFLSLCWDWC
jgi:hypothetical protein